jgi:hypothetical protein
MVTQSVSISVGAETTWDAAVREFYNRGAEAIRAQGQELVRSGRMTADEAKVWTNGQRNALIMATRDRSSPIGRIIAEVIKPRDALKTVADLERLGKTAEGIIESSGKTNLWVNRISVGFRYGGPALLTIGVGFSAYNIATSPEDEQWRVAAREAGALSGALAGGWAGGVAGCTVFGALGTAIPGVGNVAGCAAGVIVGTAGGAIAGNWAGGQAGDFVYRAIEPGGFAGAAGAGR